MPCGKVPILVLPHGISGFWSQKFNKTQNGLLTVPRISSTNFQKRPLLCTHFLVLTPPPGWIASCIMLLEVIYVLDKTWDETSLTSHTLHTERKGLVTLQWLSCRHDRKLAVTNEIHALCRSHIVVMEYNYVTMCSADGQYLIIQLIIQLLWFDLGDNWSAADPRSLCKGCG